MTAADQLVLIYREAERQLRHLIRAAALRGARGTEEYHRRQLRAVRAVLARATNATDRLAPRVAREPYERAHELAAGSLGGAAGFSGTDERAVAALARALTGRLDGSLLTVGRSADDAIRRAGLEEVAVAAARGGTRREASSRLRRRLADEGVTAFVDRAGRRWKLATYSEMAVRTTWREAATAGTVSAVRALGEDLVTVTSHLGACDLCRPFEGRTYSLGGRTPGYPRARELPPFHPNCRHVLAPSTASLDRFERELSEALAGAPRVEA